MSLDKWQQREVAEHARNNDMTEAEALADLFPEEVPARSRRAAVKELAPKEPAA
jgi:hypothetical protein